MLCDSHGCDGEARVTVFWPGQTSEKCIVCAARTTEIARAMGFAYESRPIARESSDDLPSPPWQRVETARPSFVIGRELLDAAPPCAVIQCVDHPGRPLFACYAGGLLNFYCPHCDDFVCGVPVGTDW
jgi:hypothetical protein